VADANANRFTIHAAGLQIGAYAAGLAYPLALATADFDGSGRLDLALANWLGDTVSVAVNDGSGGFPTYEVFPAGDGPAAVVAADFNGDARLDVAVADREDDTVSVLLGNGDGTLRSQVVLPAGDAPASVATGDVDGDGRADLVVANSAADTVSVLINDLLFADGFDIAGS
jgi:hypothetical protein